MSLLKTRLLLTILIFTLALISLFYWSGAATPVRADTCVQPGQACPSGTIARPDQDCEVCPPVGPCQIGIFCATDTSGGGGGGGGSGGGGGTGGSPDLGTINIDFPEIGTIVSNLYLIAVFAAAVFFLVQLLIGGIAWISAGGDEKALTSARGRITNAVFGLVIVVAAFAISALVTTLLGIPIFKAGGVNITL